MKFLPIFSISPNDPCFKVMSDWFKKKMNDPIYLQNFKKKTIIISFTIFLAKDP